MNCCSEGKKESGDLSLVECEICGTKTAKSVAAAMYLKGEEHYFCSHDCIDRWEVKHPDELW